MADLKHRYIHTNGINMHFVEQGSGPVVLLLHGFRDFWYSWRHQIPVLAQAGYHAIAPDLRGYGKTDAPIGSEKYSELHIIGDVIGLLDALGEQKVFVIAHDFGARIAWSLAFLRPDRVRAFVALSVPYHARLADGCILKYYNSTLGEGVYMLRYQEPGRTETDFARYDCKTLMRKLITFTNSGPMVAPPDKEITDILEVPEHLPPWISEEEIDSYAEEFERTGFTGALNYYRAMDLSWELMAPWTNLPVLVPVLYIIGDKDTVYGNPGTKEYIHNGALQAAVPNLKDIIVLEGIHHFLHQENPELVNAHILDFLKSS